MSLVAPKPWLLFLAGMFAGLAHGTPPSSIPREGMDPPVTVIRPPAPPKETVPVDPSNAVPDDLVMDPDEPGSPHQAKPRVAPAPKKKKVAPPPKKPAPPAPAPPITADHDSRAASRFWLNNASRNLPLAGGYKSTVPTPVMEWAQSVPGIVPRADGTYSPSQLVIMESITRKPVEIHGFLRGYRRTSLPTSLCATLWVGSSQTSPLYACVIVRIPAFRLPPQVNEFFLTLAAAKGWPIRVKGFPSYQLNTKYATGVDRLVPWELDPAEFCEIQSTPDGVTPEAGPPTVWRELTQHLAPPPAPAPPTVPAPMPMTPEPAPAAQSAPLEPPSPVESTSAAVVSQSHPVLHAPWEELDRLALTTADKEHFNSMLRLLPNDSSLAAESEQILVSARRLAKGPRPVGYFTLWPN